MLDATEARRVENAMAGMFPVAIIRKKVRNGLPSRSELVKGLIMADAIDFLIIEQCLGKGQVTIRKEDIVVLV